MQNENEVVLCVMEKNQKFIVIYVNLTDTFCGYFTKCHETVTWLKMGPLFMYLSLLLSRAGVLLMAHEYCRETGMSSCLFGCGINTFPHLSDPLNTTFLFIQLHILDWGIAQHRHSSAAGYYATP